MSASYSSWIFLYPTEKWLQAMIQCLLEYLCDYVSSRGTIFMIQICTILLLLSTFPFPTTARKPVEASFVF